MTAPPAGLAHPRAAAPPRWWFRAPAGPEARLRLVCFPYAGGGTVPFRRWPERLGPHVELWAAQLPGREGRRAEPAATDLRALGRTLAAELAHSAASPCAFFGHSMGAVLAFEAARELRRLGAPGPRALVVSAAQAPHLPHLKPPTYHLPDADFRAELARLNGTPRELLESEELMALMTPTLRADFEACQTYVYVDEPALDCPITAVAGASDTEVAPASMQAWSRHTSGAFACRVLAGDHFFIHSAAGAFLRVLAEALDPLLQGD